MTLQEKEGEDLSFSRQIEGGSGGFCDVLLILRSTAEGLSQAPPLKFLGNLEAFPVFFPF